MKSEIKIRKATIKDHKVILDMEVEFVKYIRKFNKSVNPVKFKSKFGKDLRKYLKGRKFTFLLAEKDSKVIGFLNANILKIYTTGKKFFYVNDIYIKPKYRRQGIATLLVNELYKLGKQKAISKIRLGVKVKNKTAIKFYEKSGFKATDIEMDRLIK